MFITGPDVVQTVTGEEVTFEELGGADDPRAEVGCRAHGRGRRAGPDRDARYLLRSCRRTTSIAALREPS